MDVEESERPIGEIVRRMRRQKNLTQTELGGTHYSKSYVSAFERGKITPSHRALQFFAAQLTLSEDHLTELVDRAEARQQLAAQGDSSGAFYGTGSFPSDEEWHLVDALLERSHRYGAQILRELPSFSLEHIVSAPSSRQGGYAFLLGLSAQKKGEYEESIGALEYALALAPTQQRPAVLDALGYTFALKKNPAIALYYHLRAYHLLKQVGDGKRLVERGHENDASDGSGSNGHSTQLLLDVALHCGDDYRCLGDYQPASAMYEEARLHLTAERDMQTAANLYLGLGYCLFGLVSHAALAAPTQQRRLSSEEIERLYQRSISMLMQSRSVFQVCGDREGESASRLTLMQVELALSAEQRRHLSSETSSTNKLLEARCASLLDDVEAQYHQVVLRWQEDTAARPFLDRFGDLEYAALALIVRIHAQRAALARLNNQAETALRERALASSLCQDALKALGNPAASPQQISQLLSIRTDPSISRDASLPRLPDLLAEHLENASNPLGQVELYLAAGEVAEELGRAALNQDYTHDAYARADAFYQAAIERAFPMVAGRAQDPGYLVRCYQRCISLLEERFAISPESEGEITRTLLELCNTGLSRLPGLLMPAEPFYTSG